MNVKNMIFSVNEKSQNWCLKCCIREVGWMGRNEMGKQRGGKFLQAVQDLIVSSSLGH